MTNPLAEWHDRKHSKHIPQTLTRWGVWWRLSRLWHKCEWPIVITVAVSAFALGYIGFARNAAALGQQRSVFDLLYLTLQLVPLNSGAVGSPVSWELDVARLLVPAVAAYTTLKAIALLFRERLQTLRLWHTTDHVVICGLSRKGWLLVRGFLDRGDQVVVIEQNEKSDWVEPCRERGVIVLLGDATDPEILRKALVPRARHVIAVTNDDGTNAEIAVKTEALMRTWTQHHVRHAPLTCTIHIVDPQLCELARAREMAMEEGVPFRLELFNVFDRGGRLMWEEHRDEASPSGAHLLIVGMGRLGESLIAHAARDWYVQLERAPHMAQNAPGDDAARNEPRLRVTVIDMEADRKCRSFCSRYPLLASVCDLVPRQMSVHWPEFQEAAFLASGPGTHGADIAYVCFDDDSLSLRTGLMLHHRLRNLGRPQVPVIVRMAETNGLASLLGSATDGSGVFANLHAFGLLDHTCNPAVIEANTHGTLARLIHEDYVCRELAAGQTPRTNPSLIPWDDLTPDVKQSNYDQADQIARNLRRLGHALAPLTDWDAAAFRFTADEVEHLAQMEHARFVSERIAIGWRYAVGLKDPAHKTSPALAPWDELPEQERSKTRAMICDLPSLLARAGFQIVPIDKDSVC